MSTVSPRPSSTFWSRVLLPEQRAAAAAAQQLPHHYHPLAYRLIRGSAETFREFTLQEGILANLAKEKKAKSPMGRLFYKAATEILIWRKVFSVVTNRIYQEHERVSDVRKNPTNLRNEQRPKWAWFGCSDSRFRAEKLLQGPTGSVFPYRNVGGMITKSDNPAELSHEAKRHIVYAKDNLGTQTLIVSTHGRCGCIENANTTHTCLPIGYTCEEDAVRGKLNLAMQHVVREVEEKGVDHFLALAGKPALRPEDRHLFACEIAHCLHAYNLAKNYIDKRLTRAGETPSMEVVAVHFDPRTFTTYIFNPETSKFVPLPINVSLRPRLKPAPAHTCEHH